MLYTLYLLELFSTTVLASSSCSRPCGGSQDYQQLLSSQSTCSGGPYQFPQSFEGGCGNIYYNSGSGNVSSPYQNLNNSFTNISSGNGSGPSTGDGTGNGTGNGSGNGSGSDEECTFNVSVSCNPRFNSGNKPDGTPDTNQPQSGSGSPPPPGTKGPTPFPSGPGFTPPPNSTQCQCPNGTWSFASEYTGGLCYCPQQNNNSQFQPTFCNGNQSLFTPNEFCSKPSTVPRTAIIGINELPIADNFRASSTSCPNNASPCAFS